MRWSGSVTNYHCFLLLSQTYVLGNVRSELFFVYGCGLFIFYVVFVFYSRHLYFYVFYLISKGIFHLGGLVSKMHISTIKSSDDQVTTNPVAINDIFKGFYTNLYKAETDFDEPICKQYLDKWELPRISQIDKESLEAPLSLEELHVSLKSLQKGKSPGLDGLPPELYLEIWDLVGILMLNSFNFAIEHGVFHRDQTSLISLLLKKRKDPLDCSSYRPISLIPYDLKIYAKVFASRMEDQGGPNWFHQGAQCI